MKFLSDTVSLENTSFRAAIFAIVMALCLHCVYIITFYINDVTLLYYYNYLSIFSYLLSLYVVLYKPKYIPHTVILIAFEVLSHQLIAIYLLGWGYGFQYFFIAVAAYFVIGSYTNLVIPLLLTVLSFFCLITSYYLSLDHVPTYTVGGGVKECLYLTNIVFTFFITSATPLIFSFSAKKYQSMLLYESNTDALTHLTNRKRAMELIKEEFSRSSRNESEFIVSIADIDNFKKINDGFGHAAGDKVLVEISQMFHKELRKHDIKARWGGEEFIFVLPDTNFANGILILNKLRKNIESVNVHAGEHKINITMTFGIASSKDATDPETVLKLADNALYKGKKNNKNQVVPAVCEFS